MTATFFATGSGKPSVTWPQSVDEETRLAWPARRKVVRKKS